MGIFVIGDPESKRIAALFLRVAEQLRREEIEPGTLEPSPTYAEYSRLFRENLRRAALEKERYPFEALLREYPQFEHLPGALRGDKGSQLAMAAALEESGEPTLASAFHMLAGEGEGNWSEDVMRRIDMEYRMQFLQRLHRALVF